MKVVRAEGTRSDGRVITFYSYKGGVGRSMALANVSVLLALKGKRVLVVDWDLEAPGIEQYFSRYLRRRVATRGIVDLMLARGEGKNLPWTECIQRIEVENRTIDVIGAGLRNDEYAGRLAGISWKDLFATHDLGRYLEELREEWVATYDFVLIDSRTGITDIGGICTIHLPDAIVALFTSNEQSLTGIVDVLRKARSEHAGLPVDRAPLIVVPVPARDESQSEHQRSKEWHQRFAKELVELYADWIPKGVTPADVLTILRIPYKAYWSFGEPLPVVEDGTRDPTSIGYAYDTLATLVDTGFDWTALDASRSGQAPGRDWPATLRKLKPVGFAAATLGLLVAGALFNRLSSTGQSISVPPPSDAGARDAGAIPQDAHSIEERRRDRILAEVAKPDVTSRLKVLLMREIPERVFDVDVVKRVLRGVRIPELDIPGYDTASFDATGTKILLTRSEGSILVSLSPRSLVSILPNVPSQATFSTDGQVVTYAPGSMQVWNEKGGSLAAIDHFKNFRTTFIDVVRGTDTKTTFFVNGPQGDVGTRNAIYAVRAIEGTVRRWWDSKLRVVDAGALDRGVLYVLESGEVISLQEPERPKSIRPALTGPRSRILEAVVREGRAALSVAGSAIVVDGRDRTEQLVYPKDPTARRFDSIDVDATRFVGAHGNDLVVVDRGNTKYYGPTAQPIVRVAISGDWLAAGTETAVEVWNQSNGMKTSFDSGGTRRLEIASSTGRLLVDASNGVQVWRLGVDGVIDDPKLATAAAVREALQDATWECLTTDERRRLLDEDEDTAWAMENECLRRSGLPTKSMRD
jgi:cellulose biosynthesis protein BcsQ